MLCTLIPLMMIPVCVETLGLIIFSRARESLLTVVYKRQGIGILQPVGLAHARPNYVLPYN